MNTSSVLHELLDAHLALPPEYGTGLSSHLPMALQALTALGADGDRLRRFAAAYVVRFGAHRRAPPAPRPWPGWRAGLGDFDAFDALLAHFVAEVAREGGAAVLRRALPALWPGVAAAAFHGPIRIAHAIESGHDGELAAALAYWAARWQRVIAPPARAPAWPFETWFGHFAAAGASARLEGGLISLRIAQGERTEALRDAAHRLTPPADGADALARQAARLYAETGNFTVLHLVTAARALRVLGSRVAPPDEALWPAVAAALMAARIGSRDAPPAPPAHWDEIVARAVASDDDHVIKLVHACRVHDAVCPDPAFVAAAARAVG